MNDSLARKSSDSSSSESAVVPDESGCGSCIINFLHLRPHAVDAVVDDNTKKQDADNMMTDADMIMIDASMSEDHDVGSNDMKKPPPSVCQAVGTRPRYPSPLPNDGDSRKPHPDIITNEPPSAESISAELHHTSTLSIPALLRFPHASLLPQSPNLISTTNNDGAPLLSLSSMSMNLANPNEAMMPHIPRINLQMRHSNEASYRRGTDSHRNRLHATQQTMEARQSIGGFVPIQQDSIEEEDGGEEL
eukprot:CAMPEP_0113433126 /NCGR_PEP_ID=MMETSP0013_2-20120614/34670_1 /TAXON_ID=2843 ORGANISM="Skeletonema costatum, Strain 1716" /NCGR_SAMPLE_ID=MMETSP0013_2 /ASSEMBLY_ACC=CAM_ASM_000158 /LENGTH=247 /DNA_ID=CAMNT_0000322601 /DNA_START=62 /DNA_END=806 /DNA_ORIENTATION=- /assembly_acc=CAM_ASM_000158